LRKKFSLRTQLIIILLVFVIGILGLIYISQTKFLNGFYSTSKAKTIEYIAESIASSIEKDNIEDVIDDVSMSSEVCVRVISTNEKYNIERACSLRSVDNQTIQRLAEETIDNGGSKLFDNIQYRGPGLHTDDLYIFSKIIQNDDQLTMVLVSSVVTPLTATIETIKSQYVIIVIVVIIMAILLALLLSKFLLKPIKKINDESKNLSKGLYDNSNIRFISKEYDELNNTLIDANKDILKADKARKELLGNVSHDLRTPLTMIVGYGEMIRDLPEENNENNINVIIDEAKRLSTLVDDLIDISIIENDGIILKKEKTSLNGLLNSVYHQYEKYCESQGVKFELKLKKDIEIEVDAHRIKQVLYNFINNALYHDDKKKQKIILGSEIIDGKYRVYVYDNGKGIKQENIDKIWDRYYKLNEEHKRQHIGSGIGLSLSKQILMQHGLNYGVESIEGKYSKFYFDL